jgi:chaperonin GroEL
LQAPIRQIAENAGVEGSIVVGKVLDQDEYGDLIAKGIIDPAKVVRVALQDASSVAGLLVTTEAMVAERPRKDSGSPAMPGGGMGGMDY